jgi:glutamate synthase domain-containing protein 2/glutamate synthase domain-containing protein 1/glutamate synthase domain-containing protein 3
MKHVQNYTESLIEDPRLKQRDACGVGFIAHMQGAKSHKIIEDGLTILHRLDHRGGRASDGRTGDGAGIMTQIPHAFFAKQEQSLGFSLPATGDYAVAMVFLPKDNRLRKQFEDAFVNSVQEAGQTFLGWRQVPVDDRVLGEVARDCEPLICQAFVARGAETAADKFEWKLYVIRKLVENAARRELGDDQKAFYISSFSTKTLIHKGLLLSEDIANYYVDLQDEDYQSAFSMVHQRFSTNTWPSWPLAQPFRMVCHNGEINTLRGNINWMIARTHLLKDEGLQDDLQKILPVCAPGASDSAILDNAVEFLLHTRRSVAKALTMLVPEPWENRHDMNDELRSYYEYQSCLMEPWDGPAFIGFSTGEKVGALLDRNGLRPGRYWVTIDGHVIVSSEAGVLDYDPAEVVYKGRLSPGRMFLVDMNKGEIVSDESLKRDLAREKPYANWLAENRIHFSQIKLPEEEQRPATEYSNAQVTDLQYAFGYTKEDLSMIVNPMAMNGKEPTSSMGNDAPLAVLSRKNPLLYNYFKQLFAQVTNPPIDAIREQLVTALSTNLGAQGNLFEETPEQCRMIMLNQPILTDFELQTIQDGLHKDLRSKKVSLVYDPSQHSMERAIALLRKDVEEAVAAGHQLIILSDRNVDAQHVAIPALLAVSAVHHHLIALGTRTECSLLVESGEPREVHHFCTLLGFGADAINPYLALASIFQADQRYGFTKKKSPFEMQRNYIKAIGAGILKVMSKMGISTLQSYRGAQIFEAIGLSQSFVDDYFTRTPTRIQGIGLAEIEKEALQRHAQAFGRDQRYSFENLPNGGLIHWRRDGESHLHSPDMVASMQKSTRINSREEFKRYCATIDEQSRQQLTLRGLLKIKETGSRIPLDEVEPVTEIVKRFSTGAMSFGSISKETHETIAVAMNRLGGRSNSGEGGEDASRYIPDPNGDLRRSAVKQVASGRFGVTSHYLVNADELQIKMAQGAKPGEGGQLPGHKVDEAIAKVRLSTPGVPLISPPPHHDIYSIEDLAQLIYDLKNANKYARVNVKLVSAVGVGTIAAGVAKAKADAILISGYEGGTGASPMTSIRHAGLPWELGVAETHRALVENNLRGRVALQADGQMRTPKDLAIAAMLGAEEWSVGTGALIVLGCIMMRKCHLNTCPVGIATQDPELRKKFKGKPEHLVNFFFLMAEGLREIMADLGICKVNDLVGRVDLLEKVEVDDFDKANKLDFSEILKPVNASEEFARYNCEQQDHELAKTLDEHVLIPSVECALERKMPVDLRLPIRNINRSAGTLLSAEISRRYGDKGLPDGTIRLHFVGSAGQSFMAFGAAGISARVEGEVNDYCGKGLSGGQVIVVPPSTSDLIAENNIICGNTTLYGATSGQLFVRGIAGERFAVRNSGAYAVVEGVGDHGCEYMTGGRVIVLGPTGLNFAAGMSGGIAYALNHDGDFPSRVNQEMVELSYLPETEDVEFVHEWIRRHYELTGSTIAAKILDHWPHYQAKFIQIMPTAYREALERQQKLEASENLMVERDVLQTGRFEQGGFHG